MMFCKYCGYSDGFCRCNKSYKVEDKKSHHLPSDYAPSNGHQGDCPHCNKSPKDKTAPIPPKSPCPCHPPKKTCKESLSELILSAAEIENALANALNAESSILKEGDFSPEQLLMLMNKLENLLKLTIKKEIVLEFLIEDAIKACRHTEKCRNGQCNC